MLLTSRAVGLRRVGLFTLAVAIGVIAGVHSGGAAPKIRTDFDKTFDFRQARTWAWDAKRPGAVMVARTPNDDPDRIRERVEPIIMDTVGVEMPRRRLTRSDTTPDLTLNYYLLLTLGASAQTIGQFVPPVAMWSIPPMAPSTQSIEVIEQGSLVLDLSAKGQVVWRGTAAAQIQMGLSQDKRTALLREAVREILERYPPKK